MTYITPYSSSIHSAQNLSNSINTYIFIINISIHYGSINSHYCRHQFLHSCVCKVTKSESLEFHRWTVSIPLCLTRTTLKQTYTTGQRSVTTYEGGLVEAHSSCLNK